MRWVAVQKYDVMNVADVTLANRNGSSRQRIISGLERGMKVRLLREPAHEQDANAVAVLVSGQQIGCLPAEFAKTLAPLLADEQVDVRGEIADVWSVKSGEPPGVIWMASLALSRWELRGRASGFAELLAFLKTLFGPAGRRAGHAARGALSRLTARLRSVAATAAANADGQLRRLAGDDAAFHWILRGIAVAFLVAALLIFMKLLF
jgi:hypothetical protein